MEPILGASGNPVSYIYIYSIEKKVTTLIFLRSVKKPGFGAGVLVYLDFLCIDTPTHAKAPGPAPP